MKRPLPLVVGFALVAACGGKQNADESTEAACEQNLPTEIYETFLRRPVDTNGDCLPDFWKLYDVTDDDGNVIADLSILSDPDNFDLLNNQRIRQKWLDLNFDTVVDMIRFYDVHERLVEQQVDLDFDGTIDRSDKFDEGQIISRESDEDSNGTSETTRFYRDGALQRMEIDTTGDGQADTWRFYEDGALVRIGMDVNGDLDIDEWIRRVPTDTAEAAAPADLEIRQHEGARSAHH